MYFIYHLNLRIGQVWYDENMNNSNQPGRPIAITFYNSTNLLVDGLSWSQSQFWHSFISHSRNVTVTNIFMNTTSDNGNNTVNTDGTDTWNSRDITLQNWTVQNGSCRDSCSYYHPLTPIFPQATIASQ